MRCAKEEVMQTLCKGFHAACDLDPGLSTRCLREVIRTYWLHALALVIRHAPAAALSISDALAFQQGLLAQLFLLAQLGRRSGLYVAN